MGTEVLVFCRIGSLESRAVKQRHLCPVFCRIGSLEKSMNSHTSIRQVFCRIGSLEIFATSRFRVA